MSALPDGDRYTIENDRSHRRWCYFPTMQPLDTGQAFLTLRPTGAGTETATATAATTVSEARMDNNTASASVTVVEPGMRRRAARH